MPENSADSTSGAHQAMVSVMMVTYNSAHILSDALRPLRELPDSETVVIDNASSDGSVQVVNDVFPSARVIESKTNLGFGGAMNLGGMAALGEYLLLLNPDAHISQAGAEACLKHLRENPDVGILAPAVVKSDGVTPSREAGRQPTLWRLIAHYSGLSRLSTLNSALEGLYVFPDSNITSRDVDWVSGSCMFVRKDVWQRLGGFSDRWFMYAEDVDLCLRARDLGARIVLLPGVTAMHQIGESSKTDPEQLNRHVSSLWLTNLFDLYKLREQPSRLTSLCWRSTASLGMLSRCAMYYLRAARSSGAVRSSWLRQAHDFRGHAKAINSCNLGQG